jgi:molybdenum cofactor guanylyltransferase
MTNINRENVSGIILAGGKARRMGGQDKGLIEINGQMMISYIISTLRPQVAEILINANRNEKKYAQFGYPVFSDLLSDFQGPLAGFAAAIDKVTTRYICTCPCDGPLIPDDLVARLYAALQDQSAEICVAHDGNRIQPVYALIDCKLQTSLKKYLNSGERKIDRWYAQHKYVQVDFSDKKDSFINVNTPEDQITLSNLLMH